YFFRQPENFFTINIKAYHSGCLKTYDRKRKNRYNTEVLFKCFLTTLYLKENYVRQFRYLV
ncbi:MAG: hypothetical protein IJ143_08055, partial [Neisseriaceae bacterium]|nr:hypothetical protein [Neisseriaceae bacterium]